jgi:hypothetical protein
MAKMAAIDAFLRQDLLEQCTIEESWAALATVVGEG